MLAADSSVPEEGRLLSGRNRAVATADRQRHAAAAAYRLRRPRGDDLRIDLGTAEALLGRQRVVDGGKPGLRARIGRLAADLVDRQRLQPVLERAVDLVPERPTHAHVHAARGDGDGDRDRRAGQYNKASLERHGSRRA